MRSAYTAKKIASLAMVGVAAIGLQRQEAQRDQREMQRVDLGDDRLRPECVGERQQQPGSRAGQRRFGEASADECEQSRPRPPPRSRRTDSGRAPDWLSLTARTNGVASV